MEEQSSRRLKKIASFLSKEQLAKCMKDSMIGAELHPDIHM
jgi:hypothetical protein